MCGSNLELDDPRSLTLLMHIAAALRMATRQARVGYLRVSGLAGLGSEKIFSPTAFEFGPRNLLGSVSGSVFHIWIPNG